jgi:hypothetical protein
VGWNGKVESGLSFLALGLSLVPKRGRGREAFVVSECDLWQICFCWLGSLGTSMRIKWLGLGLISLALLACEITPLPAVPTKNSANKSKSSEHEQKANLAAQVDRKRPDAELLVAIAQALADTGPVIEGLGATARGFLEQNVKGLDANEQQQLSKGQGDIVLKRPMLALVSGVETPDTLFSMASEGAVSEELRVMRNGTISPFRLQGWVRETARRSAHAYARSVFWRAMKGAPVTKQEVERLEHVAAVIPDPELLYQSRTYLAQQEPGFLRNLSVVYAALAVERNAEAKKMLTSLKPGNHSQKTSVQKAASMVALADQYTALGGTNATGTKAVQAAAIAARLGIYTKVQGLINRSGISPESNLQAAAAQTVGRLRGSLCGGLEWSNDSRSMCVLDPQAPGPISELNSLLETAFQSGQGRDPWSLDIYVGMLHVLQLVGIIPNLNSPGGQAIYKQHIASMRQALEGKDGPPATTSMALVMMGDLVFQMVTGSRDPETGGMRADYLETSSKLLEQAKRLSVSAKSDEMVEKSVLGAALGLGATNNVSELVKRVPVDGSQVWLRAQLAALFGVRNGDPSLIKEAQRVFETPSPSLRSVDQWRSRKMAVELTLMDDPKGKMLKPAEKFYEKDIPSDAGWYDWLQRGCNLVGIIARQGDYKRANELYDTLRAKVSQPAQNPDAERLYDVFLMLGEALRAVDKEPKVRFELLQELEEKLQQPISALNRDSLLYRGMWLKKLLAEDGRAACGADRACRKGVPARMEKHDAKLKELIEIGGKFSVSGVEQGVIAMPLETAFALTFSLVEGNTIVVHLQTRLFFAPTPPEFPRAFKRMLNKK